MTLNEKNVKSDGKKDMANSFDDFLINDKTPTVYVPRSGFFAKVQLAVNLIGILFWDVYTDRGFTKSLFMHCTAPGTLIAFYLPEDKKMYVYRDYTFFFKYVQVRYEEILSPCKAVSNAVTKKLIPYLKKAAFDLNDEALIRYAESSFIQKDIRPLQYHVDCLPEQVMENGYAEYLRNPDAWADNVAELMIQDEQFRNQGIKSLQAAKDINDVVAEVEKDPAHGWHKKRELLEALAGKATVTVIIQSGKEEKEFRLRTENIPVYLGQKGYLGIDEEFTFSDIKRVLYRGSVIFENNK